MKKVHHLLMLCLIMHSLISFSQNRKDTLRVLFVGNSYTFTENLPQITSIISDSTHIKLITRKSVVGGATLNEHWESRRGLKTKEIISNNKFDYVVLQDHSMRTIEHPDSTLICVKLFCDYIKAHGAKPILYMTWARKQVPQYQEQITKIYLQAAKENNIPFVPCGPAWALAQQIRPGVELFSSDRTHPCALGTFMNACLFATVLTGELPKKLPNGYSIKDYMGETVNIMYLDYLDVIFCLKITQQTLTQYKINFK